MLRTREAPDTHAAKQENRTLREERDSLERTLLSIAEDEARFGELFFELFFARRPDTRELFGAYSISEQEEMIRETLRSLAAWLERTPWLADNLHALGESHLEYGVTSDMYRSYVDVTLETARTCLGEGFDRKAEQALRRAIEGVCEIMNPDSQRTDT